MVRSLKYLIKKGLRDLVLNLKQYIAIIFIIAVAITLFVGLEANSLELERRVNLVYEQGNMGDIWVTFTPNIEDSSIVTKDYEEIVKINNNKTELVEKRLYYPSSINNFAANGLIYENYPKINKAYNLEQADDVSNSNFFFVDRGLLERYEMFTQKKVGIGSTLPVSFDLSNFSGVIDDFIDNRMIKKEPLIEFIENVDFLDDAQKEEIKNYIDDEYDNLVSEITSSVRSLLNNMNYTFDLKINGIMNHPENVQTATFTVSNFLVSKKLLLNQALDDISKEIEIEDSTIKAIIESYIYDIKDNIEYNNYEFLNNFLDGAVNQFIVKVDEGLNVSDVKSKISKYYSDKSYLMAITDLNNMPSNAIIQNDIVQSRQLMYAFPLIFFGVAVLVVLTTISQILIKERTQIGTLKSLGYNSIQILFYYIGFMDFITFIGLLLGYIIGPILLPNIMDVKYKILYSLPKLHYLFPYQSAILIILLMLLGVSLITFLIMRKDLFLTPAMSMRPPAPRIEFKKEKVKFRSISMMMALRNIRVHFAKSLMVILGVMGCTGLLICGFGIDDSIHYGKDVDMYSILGSDLQVTYNTGTLKNTVNQRLLEFKDENNNSLIEAAEEYSIMNTTASFKEKNVDIMLFYFDKGSVNFKYPKWDDLNGEGVGLAESKANELGIKEGDKITFTYSGYSYEKTVSKIFYSFTVHAIYIYTETMPELTDYRTNCWVKAKEGADLNEVKEKIINGNINGVNSAVTIYDNNARVDSYMTSVGSMTNAIKIFAIILAVIVLINLTILNFRERSREIATLKVLGYSTVEIAWSLIYETMILAIIGTLLGLVLAYPLELIVLGTNVTPLVSWKYIIFFKSYLIGFGISVGVALLINIIMTSSIKRISMSESLKSVE